jgi:hypothetical protein
LFLLVACGGSTPSGEGTNVGGNEPAAGSSVNPGGPQNPGASADAGSDGAGGKGGGGADAGGGGTGGGTTRHPECDAYGATYCRCLGSIAAANCVQNITDQCNDYFELCTMRQQAACVVQQSCAKGWLDVCSKIKC